MYVIKVNIFLFVIIDMEDVSSETYCLFIAPTSYPTATGCCSNVAHDSTSEQLQTTTRPIRCY